MDVVAVAKSQNSNRLLPKKKTAFAETIVIFPFNTYKSMNVQLRPWQADDVEPLALLANNPLIAAMVRDAFPHPYTLQDAHAWVARQMEQPGHTFVITADGAFAGGIGMEPRHDVYRHTVEIGYWVGQPFWGRGIVTRAIGLLCSHIWQQLPHIHRIEALVFATNIASQKALRKNGFLQEGIRQRAVYKNGTFLNDGIWALLRPNGW